nr:unnamed protein product [Leishmania braziliensis]
MRNAYIRALAPLASRSSPAPSSSSSLATVAATLHVSRRGHAGHNSGHNERRGRRGGRLQGQQCGHAVPQTNASVAASTALTSPHARGAFHVFLRARNSPFIGSGSGTAAAAVPLPNDLIRTTSPLHPHEPSQHHSSVLPHDSAGLSGASAEQRSRARGGVARGTPNGTTPELSWSSSSPPSSPPLPRAVPASAAEEQRKQQRVLLEEETGRRGSSTPPVLSEWSLGLPDAAARRGERRGNPQSRGQRRGRGCDDVNKEGDVNGSTAQRGGRQDFRERRRHSVQQHRHDALELARRQTSAGIAKRHLHEYEQACLHAYHILKQVEWSLASWAWAQRQGQRHGDSGHSSSSSSSSVRRSNVSEHASGVRAPQLTEGQVAAGESVPKLAGEDMDAVDARFFEYAGQIQRTLHQLTPRHFDAVREYRLRAQPRSGFPSSTAATPPSRPRHAEGPSAPRSESLGDSPGQQPLLLRLLWRLLHIQRLFISIGRRASLPRSAVDVYVNSSSCQYGIREVLRVLGSELARSTLSASTPRHLHGPRGQPWREHDGPAALPPSPPALLFSNKELFQLFYAVLCIPSEEAPGVPLYDLSTDNSTSPSSVASDRHAATSPSSHLAGVAFQQFQRDCIAAGAEAARMPLDEWCVRWWVHQYAVLGSVGAVRTPPLSMGEAMDVLQACMYATASAQVLATAAPPYVAQQRRNLQQRLLTPFTYFETPPQGATAGDRRRRRHRGSATASESSGVVEEAELSPLRVPDRRYYPQLSGALGGNRVALRIPYHLGQRYVEVFLAYLLSSVSTAPESGEAKESATTATETVAAGIEHLLRDRGRDTVRDVALLCTAILFFEVFSPMTAAFMAYAAPLCREQVELLSGHEISCVLLAYASLQRWEKAGGARTGGASTPASGSNAHTDSRAAGSRGDPLHDPTVAVQSASTASARTAAAPCSSAGKDAWNTDPPEAAVAPEPSPRLPPPPQPDHQSTGDHHSRSRRSTSARSSPPSNEKTTSTSPQSPCHAPWHLFYVTLASRAGQLSDTLSEDDVTRVLRAMELTEIEHDDLRRALESSLRLRSMRRRVLYEP